MWEVVVQGDDINSYYQGIKRGVGKEQGILSKWLVSLMQNGRD